MSKKAVDPNDTYEVRELFACGAGHFLAPGFTHWEEGECCPHRHDEDEDSHLYYRKMMVPVHASNGQLTWDYFAQNPGKWGHLPLAKS